MYKLVLLIANVYVATFLGIEQLRAETYKFSYEMAKYEVSVDSCDGKCESIQKQGYTVSTCKKRTGFIPKIEFTQWQEGLYHLYYIHFYAYEETDSDRDWQHDIYVIDDRECDNGDIIDALHGAMMNSTEVTLEINETGLSGSSIPNVELEDDIHWGSKIVSAYLHFTVSMDIGSAEVETYSN